MEKKNLQESGKQKISKIDWLYEKNIFANYINYCLRWLIIFAIALPLGYVVRTYVTQNYAIILIILFITFMIISVALRKTFKKMESIGFKVQKGYFKFLEDNLLHSKLNKGDKNVEER